MKEKRISKPTPKADVPYDAANAGDVTAFGKQLRNIAASKSFAQNAGDHPKRKQTARNKLRCGLMPMCSPGIAALAPVGKPR